MKFYALFFIGISTLLGSVQAQSIDPGSKLSPEEKNTLVERGEKLMEYRAQLVDSKEFYNLAKELTQIDTRDCQRKDDCKTLLNKLTNKRSKIQLFKTNYDLTDSMQEMHRDPEFSFFNQQNAEILRIRHKHIRINLDILPDCNMWGTVKKLECFQDEGWAIVNGDKVGDGRGDEGDSGLENSLIADVDSKLKQLLKKIKPSSTLGL